LALAWAGSLIVVRFRFLWRGRKVGQDFGLDVCCPLGEKGLGIYMIGDLMSLHEAVLVVTLTRKDGWNSDGTGGSESD